MAGTSEYVLGTAPATPPTGSVYIYGKPDKKFYLKDDTGNEYQFSAGTVIANTDDLPEGITNLYFTTERAQDAVGSALTSSPTVTLTYDDTANTITAVVVDGSITNAKIATGAAIALSKLASLTANRAVVTDGSGVMTASAATATEIGYLSGVTSNIQTQINDVQDQHPNVNATIYVSSISGNDSTGDGSFNKPLATTAAALALTGDASTTKRYAIHIRGTVTESNIYLKPWVWYVGDAWGASRLSATLGNVTLYPGAFTSGNSRCGITNVYLTGTTGINLDFVAESAAGSHVIELDNNGINGSVVINPANVNQYFQYRGQSIVFGSMTFNGALGFLFNTLVIGNVTINQAATPVVMGGLTIQNTVIGGNLSVSTSGGFANPVELIASKVTGTLTVTNTGATVTADAVSLPALASISLVTGGALTRRTDVNAVSYAPSTPADWSTTPTTAQSALDALAASRIADTVAGNLILASPNGSSGLPLFRSLAASDLPVLTGLTTSFGALSASDTVVQAFSKLVGSQSLQPQTISSDFIVPTGQNLIRAETELTGSSTLTLQGTATLRLI